MNRFAPGSAPARGKLGFAAALKLNVRIVGALMMRDGTMRYGHENLGFFWVMGKPLVLTLGVMAMWSLGNMTHGHGVGIVPFALSGYSVLTIWRHMTARSVRAIRHNAGLLFHRNVKLLDILFARALLETMGVMTAFFIAYTPLYLFDVVAPLNDPMILIGAFFLQSWFSFSVGLIIAALSEMSEAIEQFVPPMLYITLPLTGIFFMAGWLPQKWREGVLWSPLVNTMEMFRCGMFPANIATYWSASYVVVWCVIMTSIGLPLVLRAQKHVTIE